MKAMKPTLIAASLLSTFAASPAWAQCSLCKLAVEQDLSLGRAFNKAILLMMAPALAVFAGVFLLAIRSSPGLRRGGQNEKRSDKKVR